MLYDTIIIMKVKKIPACIIEEIEHDEIAFTLIRKNVKNINLRITHNGAVRISAPYKTDINIIYDFVSRKKQWILLNSNKIRAEKGFFMYLGKELPKDILKGEGIERFYKQKAQEILNQRYNKMCEALSVFPKPALNIKPMKGKYGYYTKTENTVYLNSRLILVPIECIDYVIVHELMHTIYFNHGKEFHKALKAAVPKEKELRNILAKYVLW